MRKIEKQMIDAIEVLREVRQVAQNKYAWPGGYPMLLLMNDSESICPDCAKKEYKLISYSTRHNLRDGWQAVGTYAHYEGPPIICAHCEISIDSAYGDPEEDTGA